MKLKLDLSKIVEFKPTSTNGGVAKTRKYGKRATASERKEVQVYKYFNRTGDINEAIYTTFENEVIKNSIGSVPNMKFRICGIDGGMVYGRHEGVRMFVCEPERLNCTSQERGWLGDN